MNAEVERLWDGQSEWQARARLAAEGLRSQIEALSRELDQLWCGGDTSSIQPRDSAAVRERIELWFKSRTEEYQRQVFDKYATPDSLARCWVSNIPVADLLSALIVHELPVMGEDPFMEEMSKLDGSKVETICYGMAQGLKRMMSESISQVKEVLKVQRSHVKEGGKFQLEALSVGTAIDFHGGMEGRIGSLSLLFLKAMWAEHMNSFGCKQLFESPNYNIKTCPSDEWLATVEWQLEMVEGCEGEWRPAPLGAESEERFQAFLL